MPELLLLSLGAIILLLVIFTDWRIGMLLMIPVGFLQDPIRKLLPDQPVYILLVVGMFFFVTFVSAILKKKTLNLSCLYGNNVWLKNAWLLFFLLVAIQSLNVVFRFGNPLFLAFSILTYLGPVSAILLGYYFATDDKKIYRFTKIYLLIAIPFSLSVYLSYLFGDSWVILKDVGSFSNRELVIYDVGTKLESYSGLLRVGEIAAWHAATAICFLIVIALQKRSIAFSLLSAFIVVLLVGAIILTGRRKMLVTLLLFAGFYWLILSYFWHGSFRFAVVVAVVCLFGSAVLWYQSPDSTSEHQLYLERSATVFGDIGDRLNTSIRLYQTAINRYGIFGAGAGSTAQGSQYFHDASFHSGGAGESGLGKLAIELGIPGIIIVAVLMILLAGHVYRLLVRIPARILSVNLFMAGIVSFLLSNVATYFVATQIYGDLFILLLIGIMTGFLFSSGKVVYMNMVKEGSMVRVKNTD